MIEIFVIGTSECDFINIISEKYITNPLNPEPSEFSHKVKKVIYNASFPTFFSSFEYAENVIEEIKKNAKNIEFENEHIMESILDKENENKFDVEKLKIYQLVPQKA